MSVNVHAYIHKYIYNVIYYVHHRNDGNESVIIWCDECRFESTIETRLLFTYFTKAQTIDPLLCSCHGIHKMIRNNHWMNILDLNAQKYFMQIFLACYIQGKQWRRDIKLDDSKKCGCTKSNVSYSDIIRNLFS